VLKKEILETVRKVFLIDSDKLAAQYQKSELLFSECPTTFRVTHLPVVFELGEFAQMLNEDLQELLAARTDLMRWIRSDLGEDEPRGLSARYTMLLTERQEKLSGIRQGLASEMKGVRDWWQYDISVENLRYFARAVQHESIRDQPKNQQRELLLIHNHLTDVLQTQLKLVKNLER